ncbi:MAG: sugar phosphate nucleotidyltransferase [Acidobacteriota bacterium]|nr:sugar phosphate nucleotidyltransferase [Acidobacteriota bacterium]
MALTRMGSNGNMRRQFVGIVPAAGLGMRLRPFRYPKELLPVLFTPESANNSDTSTRPMLAAEYSLLAMQGAGIHRVLVIVADWKLEIVRCLGSGKALGVELAYINQEEPRGLADAVNSSFAWIIDESVCLCLPDSVFQPVTAVKSLCSYIDETKADLALGVFPTTEPQHLGPVSFAADGAVEEVLEKPVSGTLRNTWGIAVWRPRFSRFLNDTLAGDCCCEISLGEVFNRAVKAGLDVRALYFPDGRYLDIGRMNTLTSLFVDISPGSLITI